MRHGRDVALVTAAVAAAVVLLAVGALVAGAAFDGRNAAHDARDQAEENGREQLVSREIGWQRGSIDCAVLVVDNDRTWPLPPYCLRPEVVPWYPVALCPLLGDPAGCGTRADEIGPGG